MSLELKTLPQALDSTSLIKVKPLEMCLLCSLVLKSIVASFYGEIEIVAVSSLCCSLDLSPINCVYRLAIQHFESGNAAI